MQVTEIVGAFENLRLNKLDAKQALRAGRIWEQYGQDLWFDVLNVMLHAIDKGKVDEVLDQLERHFKEHLSYQHPSVRGHVMSSLGVNQTAVMFESLCRVTLGLAPKAGG
jgi:hypothetical protein